MIYESQLVLKAKMHNPFWMKKIKCVAKIKNGIKPTPYDATKYTFWVQHKEVGFILQEVQFYLWAVSSTETQVDNLKYVRRGFLL